MDGLIASKGIELGQLADGLWMNGAHVRKLNQAGHVIGLHTHTHPTRIAYLTPQDQLHEYQENHARLAALLGEPPVAMSHPCNSYSAETLAILRKLGVKVGFRSNLNGGGSHSELEYPREDHANILREMQGCVSRYSPATSPAMSH
jgi:peptidoglycan/xylan/chitin deacetylase (PgdA/CDA1 family)